MSLDYEKVWEVMNDLDEVVQRTKIISEMCAKLRKTVYDWTDADEVLDEIEALKGFSTYILQDLEDKSIGAWNTIVVPLNPNKPSSRVGGDLDDMDLIINTNHDATIALSGMDFVGLGTDNIDISTTGIDTGTYNVSLNTEEQSGYTLRLDELQE